jgi:hypothetical protein
LSEKWLWIFSHAPKNEKDEELDLRAEISPGNARPGKAHQTCRAADGRKSRRLAAWIALAIIFEIYAYFACSEPIGLWTYGRRFPLHHNPVDLAPDYRERP